MKNNNLSAIEVTPKTGKELFLNNLKSMGTNITDFWKWYASDLVTNSLRGVLAEYIVAMAIGKTKDVRLEWDAIDLTTESGIKIEVKSSAYIQSWDQKQFSTISFGIPKSKGWNAKTNEYSNESRRQSDVYVFCVFSEKDQKKANPLNLDQWDFYVLATTKLDSAIPNQKTIVLSSLIKLCPIATDFDGLRDAIESAK